MLLYKIILYYYLVINYCLNYFNIIIFKVNKFIIVMDNNIKYFTFSIYNPFLIKIDLFLVIFFYH